MNTRPSITPFAGPSRARKDVRRDRVNILPLHGDLFFDHPICIRHPNTRRGIGISDGEIIDVCSAAGSRMPNNGRVFQAPLLEKVLARWRQRPLSVGHATSESVNQALTARLACRAPRSNSFPVRRSRA